MPQAKSILIDEQASIMGTQKSSFNLKQVSKPSVRQRAPLDSPGGQLQDVIIILEIYSRALFIRKTRGHLRKRSGQPFMRCIIKVLEGPPSLSKI